MTIAPTVPVAAKVIAFLGDGGQMGALMRAHDWSATPLGSPETWPQSLRAALSICLGSSVPTAIYWGPELRLLYNDGWMPVPGERHPWALGQPAADVWADIWDVVGPQLASVAGTGKGFSTYDQMLPLLRDGIRTETYWNYSFTPIRGEDGSVGGVFNQGHETTERVLGARRGRFLLDLSDRLRSLSDPRAVIDAAQEALGRHLDANRVGYGEVEDTARFFTTERNWTDGSVPSREGTHDLAGFGPGVLAALRAGEPLLIQDAASDPRTNAPESLAAFDAIDTRAVITASLVKEGRMQAALYVQAREPRAWRAHDAELVTEVAERTWGAVERARAEARLHDSERELRTLTDALPVLISYVDRDRRYRFNNKAYENWFGHSRDEIRGRHVREVLGDTAYERLKPQVDRALAGERFTFEQLVPYKDGARHVRVDYVPRPGAAGEVEGYYALVQDVTAQKAAEVALAESEARFRNMADHAPVMMWMSDPSGGCTYLNRSWYEFTGEAEERALGFGWMNTLHPDDLVRLEGRFGEANERPRAFRVEFRMRRADGAYRWVIDAASPRFGRDGEFLGFIGSVIDIDERRAAEERLALNEERLRLATEAAEVGFWDVDVVNDVLIWPPRVKAMFGVSPDAPVTMADFYTGLHPDDRASTGAAFAAACDPEQRALYDVEYRTVGKEDGVIRWVAAKGRGVFDANGRCVRVVGTAIEVTERKRTEAALRESEARVRALTDNLPSGMVYQITTGADGRERRFLYVSQGHEKLTGVSAEAVLADPSLPYKLILPEHRDELAAEEAAAIRDMRPFDVEARFRRADGEVRWCRIISAPRKQPDGSLIWDGMQIDVTDQKRLENRLRELNETLESRVAQRTAELEEAHEQLRQSQKLESMGQLTGGVAHDFNNLLTPIIGSLDMLIRRGVGNERERRMIDGALQSAERAKTLVQRLLAFARRQPLQPSAVHLPRLVGGMAGLIGSTLGPKIEIRVDLADDLPPAQADPNQLEMAILNLAVNARDAMPEGGTLTIAAARQNVRTGHRSKLKPGHYVRLSVADTGTGMDEATLKRAVEPFFSTKGIGKGTGLGLSMAHGLAAQLGGGLMIESAPGEGTRVELWLPVSAGPVESELGAAAAQPMRPGRGIALLVDDEDLVRLSTGDMLTDLGYEVVEASSAEEALRLVEKGLLPNLLVTDHLMPGMSGVDLARELRSRRPEMPVLIVSGYAEAEGIAPDLPRLTKPFRNAELASSLASLTLPEAGFQAPGLNTGS